MTPPKAEGLPDVIETMEELEEVLSRPSNDLKAAMSSFKGRLLVLGAGGKMGPSLCRMARRACDASGADVEIAAVARFNDPTLETTLQAAGVATIQCDLLDRKALAELPPATAVMFLAGMKFGTGGAPSKTWALNAWMPGLVAERYAGIPIVVFSSGNVYPFVPVKTAATEETPPAPVGEYAQSVLARERIFEHFSLTHGTPTTIYRLNYATELRYGVPVDVALKVASGTAIDLRMGHANVIWQGDANAIALRAREVTASPPRLLNVTGRATVSIRALATRFGELLGRPPCFTGQEEDTALLADASKAHELFGKPAVELDRLTKWIAAWVTAKGETLNKPTHYEVRDGAF